MGIAAGALPCCLPYASRAERLKTLPHRSLHLPAALGTQGGYGYLFFPLWNIEISTGKIFPVVDDVRDECKDAFCLIGRCCPLWWIIGKREACPMDSMINKSLRLLFI